MTAELPSTAGSQHVIASAEHAAGYLTWLRSFLCIDVAFILTYVALRCSRAAGWIDEIPPALILDVDMGLPEIWGYAKWSIAAAACFAAAALHAKTYLWPIGVLLTVVVLDDSLRGHEQLGTLLVDTFGLGWVLGLRPQDMGELIAFALLAVVLGACIAMAWLLFARTRGRRLATNVFVIRLGSLVGLVAVFAVAMDAVHSAGPSFFPPRMRHIVSEALGIVESGGELLAGSLLTAFVIALAAARFSQRRLQ